MQSLVRFAISCAPRSSIINIQNAVCSIANDFAIPCFGIGLVQFHFDADSTIDMCVWAISGAHCVLRNAARIPTHLFLFYTFVRSPVLFCKCSTYAMKQAVPVQTRPVEIPNSGGADGIPCGPCLPSCIMGFR